jgi:hypothetical protein
VEADETFTVSLSPLASGSIGTGTATGTIRNDDTLATYSLQPLNLPLREGSGSGVTVFEYLATRSGDLSLAASVPWQVGRYAFNNPADEADFAGGVLPAGRVAFGIGETTSIIKVRVQRDSEQEEHEFFNVILNGGRQLNEVVISTITNDDAAVPVFSLPPSELTLLG